MSIIISQGRNTWTDEMLPGVVLLTEISKCSWLLGPRHWVCITLNSEILKFFGFDVSQRIK